MKKIIPFEKEIEFKTMVSSITGISLEHTLRVKEDNLISGYFILQGNYKMTQASQIDEEFSYKIPVDIEIDEKYDTSNIIIDIDDFTYKVLEEERLLINISLSLDALVEKNIIENEELIITELDDNREMGDLDVIEDMFLETDVPEKLEIEPNENEITPPMPEKRKEKKEEEEYMEPFVSNDDIYTDKTNANASTNESEIDGMESLFSSFKEGTETFKTYSVYVVKEEDSIESIQKKYGIDKESLEEYNDLTNMNVGSKIIIPCKKKDWYDKQKDFHN